MKKKSQRRQLSRTRRERQRMLPRGLRVKTSLKLERFLKLKKVPSPVTHQIKPNSPNHQSKKNLLILKMSSRLRIKMIIRIKSFIKKNLKMLRIL